MTDKLAYSVPETAKLLSISPGTVRELVHTKQIAACFAGRKIVIPKKSIDEWLNTSAVKS